MDVSSSGRKVLYCIPFILFVSGPECYSTMTYTCNLKWFLRQHCVFNFWLFENLLSSFIYNVLFPIEVDCNLLLIFSLKVYISLIYIWINKKRYIYPQIDTFMVYWVKCNGNLEGIVLNLDCLRNIFYQYLSDFANDEQINVRYAGNETCESFIQTVVSRTLSVYYMHFLYSILMN